MVLWQYGVFATKRSPMSSSMRCTMEVKGLVWFNLILVSLTSEVFELLRKLETSAWKLGKH